jgi:hypothetical protein
MLSLSGCSFVKTKETMLIRTHPYMNVLYSTRQTTLRELSDLCGRRKPESGLLPVARGTLAVKDLYRYVADLDLLVCGPQYWFYSGFDGQPGAAGKEQKFTLEIALPVQGTIPTAVLPFFKRIPAFRCLSSRHEGAWEGIAGEHQRMQQHISDNGLKPNGIYAESYLHIDFDDPSNQITELLIGIC